jgi:hypothetical protein
MGELPLALLKEYGIKDIRQTVMHKNDPPVAYNLKIPG